MKYRPLGKTGIQVSEIGFGCWGIGGPDGPVSSYGPTDDRESISALECAFDHGVTFYDTADVYGEGGHSEKLLGDAFSYRRDQVIIASKVGMLGHSGLQDFSPYHIKTSLIATLKRLGTDYLDLYQLHCPPVDLLYDAIYQMRQLKDKGLIRAWGVSLKSPEDLQQWSGLLGPTVDGCDVIQANFSLVDQRVLDDRYTSIEPGTIRGRSVEGPSVLASCTEWDVGVIARTPLAHGFLTGHLDTADAEFAGFVLKLGQG